MSYCRKEGKDRIIFVTKEDQEQDAATVTQGDVDYDYGDGQEGLIREDGSINFECPCLGGMASGPCGVEFRESFTCFHYSTEEMKGSDCVEQFRELQACMTKYPDYYTRRSREPEDEDEGEDDDDEGEDEEDEGEDKEDEGEDEDTGDREVEQLSEVTEENKDNAQTDSETDEDEGTAL